MKVLVKVIDRGSGKIKSVLKKNFKNRKVAEKSLYDNEGLEPWDYMIFDQSGRLLFDFPRKRGWEK